MIQEEEEEGRMKELEQEGKTKNNAGSWNELWMAAVGDVWVES
jgi:hypothetical protein